MAAARAGHNQESFSNSQVATSDVAATASLLIYPSLPSNCGHRALYYSHDEQISCDNGHVRGGAQPRAFLGSAALMVQSFASPSQSTTLPTRTEVPFRNIFRDILLNLDRILSNCRHGIS